MTSISRCSSSRVTSVCRVAPGRESSPAAGCSAARASASPARSSTMARASSVGEQRRAERQHVGAVVLARVARDRLGRGHRRADAGDLVGGDRRPDAGAVDDDAGVGLAARHRAAPRPPRCPDSRPARCRRCRGRRPPGRGRAGTPPASCRSATPVWSLADRHACGCRPPAPATRRRRTTQSSRTTVMRRSRSVSCASGVTWPRARQHHRLAARRARARRPR